MLKAQKLRKSVCLVSLSSMDIFRSDKARNQEVYGDEQFRSLGSRKRRSHRFYTRQATILVFSWKIAGTTVPGSGCLNQQGFKACRCPCTRVLI